MINWKESSWILKTQFALCLNGKIHTKICETYKKRRKNHLWCTINVQSAGADIKKDTTDKDFWENAKKFVELVMRDVLKRLTK